MGITDSQLAPKAAEYVSNYINNNLSNNSKIAWLGQQPPGYYSNMFDITSEMISVDGLEHHFYDVVDCSSRSLYPFTRWNGNKPWDGIIKNYDLVVGVRITWLLNSANNLISNLKYVIDNNKNAIFDFSTGNLTETDDKFTQKRNEDDCNVVANFYEFYKKQMILLPSKGDQVLTLNDFHENGLYLKNVVNLRDFIKNRIYTIAEIEKMEK